MRTVLLQPHHMKDGAYARLIHGVRQIDPNAKELWLNPRRGIYAITVPSLMEVLKPRQNLTMLSPAPNAFKETEMHNDFFEAVLLIVGECFDGLVMITTSQPN